MMLRLHGAVASHVGNVRETNQDRAHFGGYVAVVADGMGGHQGGETAATIAISEFLEVVDPIAPGGLVELVEEANRAVFERAAEPDLRGMGTTLVALTLRPTEEKISVVNVGDSRAYFLRGDELGQLTLDHSLVEDLVRQNRLTPEQALTHPQRNILTRALGIASDVEVDRFLIPTKIGDRFLLCSDGLFNEVTEDEIGRILAEHADPHDAAEALVEAALAGAGRDNITVAVVDVVPDDGVNTEADVVPETAQMPAVASSDDDESGLRSAGVATGGGSASFDTKVTAGAVVAPLGGSGAVGLAEPEEDVEPVGDDFHLGDAIDTLEVPDTDTNTDTGARPGRFTPTLFVVGVIALLAAGAFYLSELWADQKWYVAPATEQSEQLAVFNGRPGGFLWVDAEPGEEIGVELNSLMPEAKLDVDMGRTFDSREEALLFVSTNTIPEDEEQPVDPGVLDDLENKAEQTESPTATSTTLAETSNGP